MSILNLSSELLNEIASHLVPSMDDDTGSYDPDPDMRRCRLALLSLARTGNHNLHAIAIRHLYHTICIYDLRCLFDVLHTLVYHPHLANLVRVLNLATFLDVPLDNYTDAKSEALYAGITPDMKTFPLLRLCFGDDFDDTELRELSWSTVDDFAELSFGLLLCLTSRLESLHLHGPNWNAGDFDALTTVFASAYDDDESLHGGFLPRLSRLALSADPLADGPLLAMETPQCFMGAAGNIKHLELFGANLVQEDAVVDDPEKWRSVETIHATYACTSGSWWYALCSKARPRLKSVSISISPYYDGTSPIEWEGHGQGYNAAFALCAESLESLKLDFDYVGGYASHLGPGRQLDCVQGMQRLRYLEVSVTMLFASPQAMEEVNICDVLPGPLEKVCLRDDVTEPWVDLLSVGQDTEEETLGANLTVEDLEKEHVRLVRRAFLQLVLESEPRLPRLQSVRVVVNKTHWLFDEQQLGGLCTVEDEVARVTITCAPGPSRVRE